MSNTDIEALLICNSNMFVPTVLTEILSNPDKRYIVISDTANIVKLFDFFAFPNVVFYKYGTNLLGVFKEKKRLLVLFKPYNIKQVVFFHTEWGQIANWLIRKLSISIPICFCEIYKPLPLPKAPLSWKVLKMYFFQYILWGVRVKVIIRGKPFPSLPDSFYKEVKAKTIKMPIDNSLISKITIDKLYGDKSYPKILLLTGSVVDVGYVEVEKSVYIEYINKLIDEIGTENVASKCHPRFSNLYGKENDLKQIPSFIPGNMILDQFVSVIGFESTLLVEAARANKLAISLLDVIPSGNSEVIERSKLFLSTRLEGKGVIHYPKSIVEVHELLKNEAI